MAFSSPGVSAPEKEMTDDELVDCLRKLIDERMKLMAKVKEVEADVVGARKGTEELMAEGGKLRGEILSALVSICYNCKSSYHNMY